MATASHRPQDLQGIGFACPRKILLIRGLQTTARRCRRWHRSSTATRRTRRGRRLRPWSHTRALLGFVEGLTEPLQTSGEVWTYVASALGLELRNGALQFSKFISSL